MKSTTPLSPERVRALTAQYAPAPSALPPAIPRAKKPCEPNSTYRIVSASEREQMLALWHAGKHLCDIAKESGREPSVVRCTLLRAGINTKERPRKTSARQNIISELRSGKSTAEIAKKRRTPIRYIVGLAREAGIPAGEIYARKERAA